MIWRLPGAALAGVLIVSACAAPTAQPEPASPMPSWANRQPIDDEAAAVITHERVICTSDSDCAVKWSSAVNWVVRQSHWKVQTQSDTLLETYGPGDTRYPSFILTKQLQPHGAAMLTLEANCGNLECLLLKPLYEASFIRGVDGGPEEQKTDPFAIAALMREAQMNLEAVRIQ